MKELILTVWFILLAFSFASIDLCIFNIEKNDIKESRHREELLYQEVKNLDYEISILTELQKNIKG